MISLTSYAFVSMVLFSIGVIGIIARRNIFVIYMSNELIRKRDEHGVRIAGAYSKKYCKDNEELGDMPDLSAILGVAIEQLNVRKAGRIPDYADDPQGIESFVSATQMYFEYITEANRQNDEKLIPDIVMRQTATVTTEITPAIRNGNNKTTDQSDTDDFVRLTAPGFQIPGCFFGLSAYYN